MKITKNRSGVYVASFRTAEGKTKTLSTKCTDRAEAERVVKESGLKDLEMAAKAGRLSREAIGHIVTGKKLNTATALEKYFAWMESSGKAPKSIANAKFTCQSWVEEKGLANLPPSAITEDHIDPWINNSTDGTKASYRAIKLSHIREFFEFCTVKGWSIGNPARLVRVRFDILSHEQKEPAKKEPFTALEVKRLIADCQKRGDVFWEFAIRISNEIGLRMGDICQLEWACFKEPGRVVVWTDKRDRRISVPISSELSELLATIPPLSSQYVFPDQREVVRDVDLRHKFSMQFKRICERLNIPGKSFHCLRHTCITRWAKEGKSLESIGKDVGHADTATTKGYVH